ncbi:hypothetical protein [Candidatus Arsenophonus triatominarum]|uniref:Uncharacterized protein n=1 Tax=Arsenophonus endosymbiont of Trialeurodes vaporariorum TaxID=235567 RepID=A0A3B0LUR9_9GAMM|nr:hypothetical protein [Candidatus Arsenophonus triatominarum]
MTEDKKEISLVDIQKDIEEIKNNIKRRNLLSGLILIIMIIFILSIISLGLSFKMNIEDKFNLITTEYNKVKSLENKLKKFLP